MFGKRLKCSKSNILSDQGENSMIIACKDNYRTRMTTGKNSKLTLDDSK